MAITDDNETEAQVNGQAPRFSLRALNQARLLGRVERLRGVAMNANPYPRGSDQWQAFNEGWARDLDNPLVSDFRSCRNF